MSKSIIVTLLAIFLSLLLLACADNSSPEVSVTGVPSTMEASPATTVDLQEQFVSPVSSVATLEEANSMSQLPELPTPEAGMGVVYGLIGSPTTERGRVFTVGSFIYLAKLNYTQNEEGTPIVPVASLDLDNDPGVKVQEGEYFVFSNITPGEYAFVLVSPVDNYIIPGDHSSSFKIVEVMSGDVADVGEISLP